MSFPSVRRLLILPLLFLVLQLFSSNLAPAQLLGWKKKIDVAGIGNPLAYNPMNDRTIFGAGMVGTTGTVVVSCDRGITWGILSVVTGGGRVKSISVSPLDTLVLLVGQEGVTVDRVVKSTDGGLSWTQTLTGDFSFYGVPVEFNPSHPDTVFTMTGSTLHRSTDFGLTWSVMNSATGFNAWCDAALRPDSVNVMYVGDNSSGIWKTDDGGATFRKVYQTTGEIPMIAIDQSEPSVAYATKYGGGGGVLKSTDFGETWSPIMQFSGIQCWGVALGVLQPGLILVGTYNPPYTTYLSTDEGGAWREISCGLASLLNYGVLALDSSAMFLMQDDGLYALQRVDLDSHPTSTIDGKIEDAAHLPVQAKVRLSFARCDTPMTMATMTDSTGGFSFGQLYVSDPPVLSTYTIRIDPSLPFSHLAVAPIHLDTVPASSNYTLDTADVAIAGTDSVGYSTYYETALDSLGISWNATNTLAGGLSRYDLIPRLKKKTLIYFSGNSRELVDGSTLAGLSAVHRTGGHLFITGQDIVELNDTDSLFSAILGIGFASNTIASYVAGVVGDVMDGEAFFTSGGTGAQNQKSRDKLTSLQSGVVPILTYDGSADSVYGAVRVSSRDGSGRAIVAGFGFEAVNSADERKEFMRRAIGYLDGSIVLGVGEERGPALPLNARLHQNYPNPFNPSTIVSYDVVRAGLVEITIFDLLGRETARLVTEKKEPGRYSVEWNAEGAPGGIYFCRLKTNSGTEIKKMTLIR